VKRQSSFWPTSRIGLGAAFTPVGEPLGTIAIAALNADFWYLVRLLGPLMVAGIVIVGAISLFFPAQYGHSLNADAHPDTWSEIVHSRGDGLHVRGRAGRSVVGLTYAGR
jgi:Protein of unknown function (DUF1646)